MIAGGVIVLVAVSIKLAKLKPADPVVELSSLWPDSVVRGDMVRDVRGPGTLVPEQVRLITALVTGRVERVLAQTGQEVAGDAPLVEMSNPSEQIATMQTEQNLRTGESELLRLKSKLKSDKLASEATLVSARNRYAQAKREADAEEALFTRKLSTSFEVQTRREQLEDARVALQTAEAQATLQEETNEAQIKAQEGLIDQLRATNALQQTKVRGLTVRAPEGGVLQDLSLLLGQWVQEGALLARVVQPGKLKAVLRIPEGLAKDVQLGQVAKIDTRNGIIEGRISRKDPSAQAGTVTVDVALTGPLPSGAVPDMTVEGTIVIERLSNVLYTGRPSPGGASGTISLFKIVEEGKAAVRVQVELGRISVNQVEILRGLEAGDKVILSDMTEYGSSERVRIKQE